MGTHSLESTPPHVKVTGLRQAADVEGFLALGTTHQREAYSLADAARGSAWLGQDFASQESLTCSSEPDIIADACEVTALSALLSGRSLVRPGRLAPGPGLALATLSIPVVLVAPVMVLVDDRVTATPGYEVAVDRECRDKRHC